MDRSGLSHVVRGIANLALRGLTIGSRFALLFGLAYFLEPAEVGLFGLFFATITFCVLLVGGEFYTYSQRELLAADGDRRSFVLQHQILVYGCIYAVAAIPLATVFWFGFLPLSLIFWFYLLLVSEHLSQEISRVLVVMDKALTASLVLFLRSGAWVWIVLVFMAVSDERRTLTIVLTYWLVFGLLANAIGVLAVLRASSPLRRWQLDMSWIVRGLRVSTAFLVGSLCVRALLTLDRYAVEYLAGLERLGVYAVYAGVAMVVPAVLDAGLFVFAYPRMVSAFRKGAVPEFKQRLRNLAVRGTALALGCGIFVVALAEPLFGLLGKPEYMDALHVFSILVLASVFYSLGMIPHYGLYSMDKDRQILVSQASAVAVFIVSLMLLKARLPFESAAIAAASAFLWIFVTKSLLFRIALNNHARQNSVD